MYSLPGYDSWKLDIPPEAVDNECVKCGHEAHTANKCVAIAAIIRHSNEDDDYEEVDCVCDREGIICCDRDLEIGHRGRCEFAP